MWFSVREYVIVEVLLRPARIRSNKMLLFNRTPANKQIRYFDVLKLPGTNRALWPWQRDKRETIQSWYIIAGRGTATRGPVSQYLEGAARETQETFRQRVQERIPESWSEIWRAKLKVTESHVTFYPPWGLLRYCRTCIACSGGYITA